MMTTKGVLSTRCRGDYDCCCDLIPDKIVKITDGWCGIEYINPSTNEREVLFTPERYFDEIDFASFGYNCQKVYKLYRWRDDSYTFKRDNIDKLFNSMEEVEEYKQTHSLDEWHGWGVYTQYVVKEVA